jgi:hypothetical protein
MHTWPLLVEDLVEPDPPFASADRHYFCPTPTDSRPSDSRLSTITEEGTIRESLAPTPPNIIITDTSQHTRDDSDVTIMNATSLIPTMAGPQYNADDAIA